MLTTINQARKHRESLTALCVHLGLEPYNTRTPDIFEKLFTNIENEVGEYFYECPEDANGEPIKPGMLTKSDGDVCGIGRDSAYFRDVGKAQPLYCLDAGLVELMHIDGEQLLEIVAKAVKDGFLTQCEMEAIVLFIRRVDDES